MAVKKVDKPEENKKLLVNCSLGSVVSLPLYRDDPTKRKVLVMGLVILVFIAGVIISQSSAIAANEQCKLEYCRILK